MVKRFDCTTVTEWGDTYGEMKENKDGEFVRYEDYAELEVRIKELEARGE